MDKLLSTGGREPPNKRLPLVAALLAAGLVGLTGCESVGQGGAGPCPHPISEVRQVEFSQVNLVSPSQLANACGRKGVSACVNLVTKEVWFDRALSPRDRINFISHEQCHLYEVEVLGMTVEETQAHLGWDVRSASHGVL